MSDIVTPTCWYAGFTRRWHAGDSAPWLARSGDRVDGHGARMAVLALHFWGDGASRELLAACITHDLGEIVTGDMPLGAKANPVLRGALAAAEGAALDGMGMRVEVSGADWRRLKFLDRLDAWLWAQHHAPQLMEREDWALARLDLLTQADALGVVL
ncbi:hypothetical protein [Gemmobacter nectariphilus]|uniref:hypothetical protein n=1 Tax=Gemmobacter nectariphilus TaxID=220343 RepID=UPI0004858B86|nr:hypothetical protein [Gemmobacter nectariphilus]